MKYLGYNNLSQYSFQISEHLSIVLACNVRHQVDMYSQYKCNVKHWLKDKGNPLKKS